MERSLTQDQMQSEITEDEYEENQYENYSFVRIIGRGSFGIVVETINVNGKRRAIKFIDANDVSNVGEMNNLSHNTIDHLFVVKCFKLWLDRSANVFEKWENVSNGEICESIPEWFHAMELEFCSGDLRSYIDKRNNLLASDPDDLEVKEMNESLEMCCQQISQALCHLHKQGVFHRDLKPANILYNRRMTWKISDFGLSRYLYSKRAKETTISGNISEENEDISLTAIGGTRYAAPEISGSEYTEKVDIFSFGLIIIEISYHLNDKIERENCFKAFKYEEEYSGQVVADIFKNWIPIAQTMVYEEPERRPTAHEVVRKCQSVLLRDFEYIRMITSGMCFAVFECNKIKEGKRAIKFSIPRYSCEYELSNHENVNCNYIVKCYRTWIEEKEKLLHTPFVSLGDQNAPERFLAIELELCAGNLYEYLKTRNREYYQDNISYTDLISKYGINLKKCVTQILYGIRHLHDELNIVHRNLNATHILFTSNFNWKICGFLNCIKSNTLRKEYILTDIIMCAHVEKSDIEDIGDLIFKIAYTFPDFETYFKKYQIMREKFEFPERQCLNVFDDWKSAVLEMTDPDYTERPQARDVIIKYGLIDPYPE